MDDPFLVRGLERVGIWRARRARLVSGMMPDRIIRSRLGGGRIAS
jgi:hypothetical protein